jgi:hypothetical protein
MGMYFIVLYELRAGPGMKSTGVEAEGRIRCGYGSTSRSISYQGKRTAGNDNS